MNAEKLAGPFVADRPLAERPLAVLAVIVVAANMCRNLALSEICFRLRGLPALVADRSVTRRRKIGGNENG